MNQARVLIVHPEPSILALLGSMLQSLGHQIEEASNDRAAVRRLDRGGIDLMIAVLTRSIPRHSSCYLILAGSILRCRSCCFSPAQVRRRLARRPGWERRPCSGSRCRRPNFGPQ